MISAQSTSHHEQGETYGEWRQNRATRRNGEHDCNGYCCNGRRSGEALRGAQEVAALPGQERPERDCDQNGHEQRTECAVEERRADGDLFSGQSLQGERIKRAHEHGPAGAYQEDVIEHQGPFARHRRKQSTLLEQGSAQREQHERTTDKQNQNGKNEHPAHRIAGERMNRGKHSRANQKCPNQRQRERKDREEDSPDLQSVTLLHHQGGMEKSGGGEPGHERSILDGVPEPPATPAQRVIGPVGAHRDSEGQEHPGQECPWPHPSRPRRVDTTLDQGRERERE